MAINRRKFLSGASVAAATLVGCGKTSTAGTQQPLGEQVSALSKAVEKPNILLLCIDDLRDWVGYKAAHPGVHTPHIDRLRSQSFSYDRAYCAVPVCIASRGSTLWGLTPETAQLDGLEDDKPYSALSKSKDLHPLPYWFSQAGYETISTGKVFHYQMGTRRFWDVFEPYTNIPLAWGDHGTLFDFGLQEEGKVHQDQVAANFAKAQFASSHEKPWFMSIGLFQPHVPWRLPQWAYDLHPLEDVVLPEVRQDDLDDMPPLAVDLAHKPASMLNGTLFKQHDAVMKSGLWREHVQAYLAACSHTDAMVGQILDALDSSAYADNTAVVLWSDHGYHLGEKLHWRKMALWEHATRIPLLVRAPWRVPGGGSFSAPVSLVDLAPTLTDLAGFAPPEQFEGESLIGVTQEQAASRPAHMRWGTAVSTRKGKWRWTRYEDGGQELYNLEEDPREYNNLLGKAGVLKGGLASLA
ncbi:MAG: sulfatase [Pseudomonadales bacterium]